MRSRGAKVEILAQGRAAIPAAHAYCLEPDLFSGIVFDRKPSSWKSVLEDPDLACGFADAVYGAYGTYDWTDLVR